jgi:hypothetical protein
MLAYEAKRAVARRRGVGTRLTGVAQLLAFVGVVGVPLLVGLGPRWLRRWTIAMLAVTSMGVWATVPDTEYVLIVMVVVVVAAIVVFPTGWEAPPLVSAAVALVIMLAAVEGSAGNAAPIARAIGCFAALLAVPVAGRLMGSSEERHPLPVVVLAIHTIVALVCSRALIRQESASLVTGVVAVALLATVAALYVAPRR